jgi:hypothetical protein
MLTTLQSVFGSQSPRRKVLNEDWIPAARGRGKDRPLGRPPARIRTCRLTASGSYFGCLTSKRLFGYRCRILGFVSQRAAI